MGHTFSSAESAHVISAIDHLVKASAVELPFDVAIIDELALVAKSSGFLGDGTANTLGPNLSFQEECKLRPISTLLRFLLYLGAT